MRAAAQIETKVHQGRGQERRPLRQRPPLPVIGNPAVANRRHRIIMRFDMGIEQVRSRSDNPPGAERKDQKTLP